MLGRGTGMRMSGNRQSQPSVDIVLSKITCSFGTWFLLANQYRKWVPRPELETKFVQQWSKGCRHTSAVMREMFEAGLVDFGVLMRDLLFFSL